VVEFLSGKSGNAARTKWHEYLLTFKGKSMKPEKGIQEVNYHMDLACTYHGFDHGQDTKFLTYNGAIHVCNSFGNKDLDARRPILMTLLEEHIKPKPPAPKRPRLVDMSTLVSGMQRQVARRIDNGIASVRTEIQSVGSAVTTVTCAVDSIQSNLNSNHVDMVAKMEKLQKMNASLSKALSNEQKAHEVTRTLLKDQQTMTQNKQTCISIQIQEIAGLKKRLAKENNSAVSTQILQLEKVTKAENRRTFAVVREISPATTGAVIRVVSRAACGR